MDKNSPKITINLLLHKLIYLIYNISQNATHGLIMDIYALKAFIKTAEQLHFGKASQACNMTPSTLSRTIQRLEDELGHPLFIRDNRSVTLTQAGRRLLDYSRNAVQEWQQFSETLSEEDEITGQLSIYASITAVYTLLPELLESYRKEYPSVQLDLQTGAAEQAVPKVLSGEIDIAVAAQPDNIQTPLEFTPLIKTPLVFIAPKKTSSFKMEPGARLDLSTLPLVLPQSGAARDRLEKLLKKKNITPTISTEVSGNEALIAMVRLGAGVGIVPRLVLQRSPFRENVTIIEKAPRLKPFVVGLCTTKRNLKRPAVNAMWKLA